MPGPREPDRRHTAADAWLPWLSCGCLGAAVLLIALLVSEPRPACPEPTPAEDTAR